MSHTLLIGYGNPLRGDDGVGWVVAEMVAARQTAVSVLIRHQLTPELAEPISQAARVVFIDATAIGTPGDLVCHHLTPEGASGQLFSHTCNPAGLLHMAQMLYGQAPVGYLFTVTGASFGYEEQLSEVVTAILPQLCAKIEGVMSKT